MSRLMRLILNNNRGVAAPKAEIMDKPDSPKAEQLNAKLRDELHRLFAERRQALTDAQRAVIDAFCAVDRHMSAEQFEATAADGGTAVDTAVVQEVMGLLCELGFAVRRDFGDGPRYEHLHVGEHHDHLICTQCGRVVEFTDPRMEDLQTFHASRLGFRPIRHKLEIYGICRQCDAARQPTRPLSVCEVGEKLVVVRIDADPQQARHLTDMGLVAGASVEVLGRAGTLMVAVGHTRLGLEPKIAETVLVAPRPAAAVGPGPRGGGPGQGLGRGLGRRRRWRRGQ